MVELKVKKRYKDLQKGDSVFVGEILTTDPKRARMLLEKGFVEVLKIDKLKKGER